MVDEIKTEELAAHIKEITPPAAAALGVAAVEMERAGGAGFVAGEIQARPSRLALGPGPSASGCRRGSANICGGKSRPVRSK